MLLVPSSVMEGFTVGVAFIIALNQVFSLPLRGRCEPILIFLQLNFALGLGQIPKHGEFILNVLESFRHITQTGIPAKAIDYLIFLTAL